MIFLIFSILSSAAIYVIFKYIDRLKISTFDVIIINYLTASVLGFLLSEPQADIFPLHQNQWFPYAILIGVLFILMFVVIAKSSQVVGIAITTVSNKMSVIIPITFSIFIDPLDQLTNLKATGIILAIVAVFLSVYRKRKVEFDPRNIYLPIILFLGMGVVDSIVKYAQQFYVDDDVLPLFTVILFIMAALSGLITKLFRRTPFNALLSPRVLFWGILLGISNYGSLYFVIKALNYKDVIGNNIDGSVVFGINNLGIIALSVVIGLLIFKEKILKINWIGILISLIAIYILSIT
ncbi:MAG: DMT family transporter [Bacteroidales bacterium]|jgi:drug/metabolite transporter (DMT)-like permease|nr:DMT family transporter [Bacteroidales bacterium]